MHFLTCFSRFFPHSTSTIIPPTRPATSLLSGHFFSTQPPAAGAASAAASKQHTIGAEQRSKAKNFEAIVVARLPAFFLFPVFLHAAENEWRRVGKLPKKRKNEVRRSTYFAYLKRQFSFPILWTTKKKKRKDKARHGDAHAKDERKF